MGRKNQKGRRAKTRRLFSLTASVPRADYFRVKCAIRIIDLTIRYDGIRCFHMDMALPFASQAPFTGSNARPATVQPASRVMHS